MKTKQLDQARYAIAAAFLIGGISVGLWFVHIPVVTQRLNISTSMLGLVFLTSAVGATTSQLQTGRVITYMGSHKALLLSMPIILVAAVLPIIAWNILALFFFALLFGAAAGFYNISVNMQATQIETQRKKPTMSYFHGFFSLGGIIAAALGSAIISIGWSDGRGAAFTMLFLLVICAFLSNYYLHQNVENNSARKTTKFQWPTKSIILLAAIIFVAQMIEGAIGDWAALFLANIKHTSLNVATSGYAALCIAMALMRFAGAAIISKTSEKIVISAGGGLIVLGIIIAIFASSPLLSASGFFIVGLGVANMYPILLGTAGRTQDMSPSIAVAITATMGQIGTILGPTMIGFIADVYNLSYGIGFLGIMAALIILGGIMHKD